MSYKTEQEGFWAGDFGNDYIGRNNSPDLLPARIHAFSQILARTKNVNSFLEFGANIGQNFLALSTLKPHAAFSGIEINAKARESLEKIPNTTVFPGSMLDFTAEELGQHDLTFTAHVLIHINPEKLPDVFKLMYDCSKKYILVKEYFNAHPVEMTYRGHSEKLFKRDFAGDLMDMYPDLELIDYGFQYKRDPNFPSDDSSWFLLQKKG